MDSLTIGQLNLHNDRVATSELDKLIIDFNLDIVLVQEQYQNTRLRHKVVQLDTKARAGIYVSRSSNFTVTSLRNLMTPHCAVAEVSSATFKVYVVSCYFQYSDPVAPHIHNLRHVLRSLAGCKVIVGADVNASSSLWYGKVRSTDYERRCAVEDFIAEMNLTIHNTPDAPPTFCSQMGESCIDVTLSSADVRLDRWRVLPDASCSDHRLIVYEFVPVVSQGSSHVTGNFRYKSKGANWEFFGSLFASHAKDFTRDGLSAEESAEIMSDTFTYCADIAIGRGPMTNIRRCDWWCDYLTEQRKTYRRARKHLNKLKKRQVTGDSLTTALSTFRVARSRYRASVEKSKGNLLRKVVEKLDKEGPWSPLYHEFKANRSVDLAYVQNIRVNNKHTTGIEETTEVLLNTLIPDDSHVNDNDYHQQIRAWAAVPPESPASDLPSTDEFNNVVRRLPLNKSSGEDKISNRMIKEACKAAGDALLTVYNRCIVEGVFPRIWRRGFIRIIPKSGDKPPDDPKSYRPITLLPSLGKLLERLIVPRLLPDGPKFHNNQFGFTVGKSTVDAALSVRKIVNTSEHKYVLGIFLDISGAFDNAWWPMLLLKIKARGCYNNIYNLLCSYFSNGSAKLKLGHHSISKPLTMGCPQGSVIGPYLWNLGFDDFLAIPLPSGCSLTGYADDGLLLIQSSTRAGLENLADTCLRLISQWGNRNRLTFAPQKTYQLILKGDLKSWPSIKFNNVPVKRKQSVCYLGLVLERNFTFIDHIKTVGEKAKNNFYALTRISKSTWGLSFLTLKTIYGATYLGCMCYGAPVWADRATIGAARRKLLQSQRLALLFLSKAYRTVSTEALPVLAGVLPVDLEVQRRAAMYYSARGTTDADFLTHRDRAKISRLFKPQSDVWDELLSEWQCRWDNSIKGRHLYQFFPSVRERLARTWLEVDHCVAQFLTGHGNFKSKLFSFKLVPSPFCQCSTSDCEYEQSAHHILWECTLWQNERNIMLDSVQTTSGVIYYTDLVETRTNFRAFKHFCHTYYWNQI
jgi:hypothetical protein